MLIGMGLRLLLLLVFLAAATSAGSNAPKLVTTLPGYSGELSFKLETGYVGVGENETAQLFYYFVESQRNPLRDPILIWISGGPGCSGLGSFVFESGPLTFKLGHYNGSLPTLHDNPWTWTQGLNIVYLDAPVGAGFSFSETSDGYAMDDYKYVAQAYEFIQKWLSEHPQFLENQLYVGGESYGGKPVPMIVQQIVIGNEAGSVPMINLKGYMLGSPVTDSFTDSNAKIPLAHRLTLISDQLYEGYNHMLCYNWANNKGVQEALGVREGTKQFWQYCNTTLAYTTTVTNVVGYHRNLTNADLRLLVYSGDHDISVPNIGTQEWIKSLNLTTDESWRVWSVDGQTAGYTEKLINDYFTLTYATVKGGGHYAAEDMVKECAAMMDRWMAYFPL
ncbi:serine carboxypeptidase-like 10 isoform X2 [Juglans microcarpa x Juglans regia]|uniref:serine carboxypeptidase-like 10 isoform X2 n=1 Tax=Juglans microcarpa x Juglans regia TaxID=2249226 RepID=UPI001B7ECBA0|nr:serine carboxypeptidase-like 10 isoform X2 [Juglans microcarpa x Juglans regia]